MLKVWNVSLILATGILCILGTFLVRSGILDSIHAFVQEGNTIAWAFTSLICVMIAGSVYLVVSRRKDALRSEARHRLAALARVDVPREQPRARRASRSSSSGARSSR